MKYNYNDMFTIEIGEKSDIEVVWGGLDIGFTIKGDFLPMIKIGAIEHYINNSEFLPLDTDDENNAFASEVFVEMFEGRVCQFGNDLEPWRIEVCEPSYQGGIIDLDEDKFEMRNVKKNEFINTLVDLAKEVKKQYIINLGVSINEVVLFSKALYKYGCGEYHIQVTGDSELTCDDGKEDCFKIGIVTITEDTKIKDIISQINKLLFVDRTKQLVERYGEYDIPFYKIKELDCYRCDYSMELDDIKKMIIECKENGESDLVTSDNVMIVMEIGNFDIEFTHHDIDENGLNSGFYCCAKYEHLRCGWQSEGFADLETSLELFDNKDTLEEAMYNSMIRYMKENGFTWSKEN